MTIQLNADHNLSIHEGFADKLTATLKDELKRFTEHITRLEVHLSDEMEKKRRLKISVACWRHAWKASSR